MPLTPLHLAYALPLKLKLRQLSLAGLLIGSMIPDLDQPIMSLLGQWPNRLVMHSLAGAFTVNALACFILAWLLAELRLERVGIRCFAGLRFDKIFYVSAVLGSLTHIAVDSLYHQHNPLLWPLMQNVDSPLYPLIGYRIYMVFDILSLLLLLLGIRQVLKREGQGLRFLLREPKKALEMITGM